MEVDVELGEAAVLRGAVAALEAAHGEASGLQVPAAAEAHVHRGRQKDAHLRVQVADAAAAAGDAAAVVPGRRQRDELLIAGERRSDRHAAPPGHGRRSVGAAVGLAAGDDAERRRRRRPELGPPLVLLSAGQPLAHGYDELLAREFRLDRRLRRESAAPRRGLNHGSGSATLAARSIIVIISSGSGGGSRGDRGRRVHLQTRLRTLLVIVRLGGDDDVQVSYESPRNMFALLRTTERIGRGHYFSRGKKSRASRNLSPEVVI